MNVVSVFLC